MDEPHLVCVEYPANVINEDKMLETLGGYSNINETFSKTNRKLELNFRPNAPGSKPTCGERTKTSSMLIKATLMKNQRTGETKVVHEIVGPIEATYKFKGLCDFQYLPMTKDKTSGKYESIAEQVTLDKLPSHKDYLSGK